MQEKILRTNSCLGNFQECPSLIFFPWEPKRPGSNKDHTFREQAEKLKVISKNQPRIKRTSSLFTCIPDYTEIEILETKKLVQHIVYKWLVFK